MMTLRSQSSKQQIPNKAKEAAISFFKTEDLIAKTNEKKVAEGIKRILNRQSSLTDKEILLKILKLTTQFCIDHGIQLDNKPLEEDDILISTKISELTAISGIKVGTQDNAEESNEPETSNLETNEAEEDLATTSREDYKEEEEKESGDNYTTKSDLTINSRVDVENIHIQDEEDKLTTASGFTLSLASPNKGDNNTTMSGLTVMDNEEEQKDE
eukprot:15337372-Ditylum_brightwellii.AAC.1